MSLNNLILTPSLMKQLYHNSLYQNKNTVFVSNADNAIESVFKFTGKNQKNVLVVVNYTDVPTITDEDLSFLSQLLKACQLTLADVAIFNFNKYDAHHFSQIFDYFKANNVLLFGITTADFGFPFQTLTYKLQNHNQINVISSHALSEIKEDNTQKSKLWAGLKQMFNI